jgi:hypothetical protein
VAAKQLEGAAYQLVQFLRVEAQVGIVNKVYKQFVTV